MESPGKIELPRAFEHADIDHLVVLIADMLDRLIEHNDKIPLSPEALTRFHSRSPPSISVLEYLRRIVKYANVERTCLLITLHYIDQLCTRLPHFTLSSLTCHRFIITAVVVASKALCDSFCTNAHYAKVGGIRVGELNVLEKELLSSLDWRLTSTREVLEAYYVNLIRTHSAGAYTLAAESTSPLLTDIDSDMDSLYSASPSPSGPPAILEDEKTSPPQAQQQQPMVIMKGGLLHTPVPNGIVTAVAARSSVDLAQNQNLVASTSASAIEPTAVLIDRATLSPKPSTGPTLEQNMAFEALRRASETNTGMVVPSASMGGTNATPDSSKGTTSFSRSPDQKGFSPRPVLQITIEHPPPSALSSSSSTVSLSSTSSSATRLSHHKLMNSSWSANNGPNNTDSNLIILRSPQKRRTTDFRREEGDGFFSPERRAGDAMPKGCDGGEDASGDGILCDGVDIDSVRPRTRLRIDYESQGLG